jgi:hypothetical protein
MNIFSEKAVMAIEKSVTNFLFLIQIKLRKMPVPSQGYYGFHSFSVVD